MKKSGKDRLKCAVYESTRAPLTRSPFPNGEGKEEGGFAVPKGSQPRLAALGSPFHGKGLAWTLPPSYGRRCPEGAEVGWGSGMKKSKGDRLKYAIYESTQAPLTRFPFSNGEGCDTRASLSPYRQSEYMDVWKNNTPGTAFPSRGRWRAKRAG